MTPTNKAAMRAAVLIHERLAGSKCQDAPLYLPEYSWNNIQQLRRQIDLARQRGWHRAAKRLTENLAVLDDCRHEVENTLRTLQSRLRERQAASASDIYQDILALRDEFEEVDIDLNEHELSVTTDRIVLEEINLGHFQIRLDWHHLDRSPAYRVVALDPNPAAKSDDITHPHVQDEHLCEGEGRTAIQAAVTEGRLYDFFVLVSQVLHSYGRGSAYVELNDWTGAPCEDCGATVDADERYYCQRCESMLCDSCSVSCQQCGESHCSGCLNPCAACGYDYCSSCLATCPVCRKRFCEDCLEEGLCLSCHQEQQNEEHEHDASENTRNEPVAPGA